MVLPFYTHVRAGDDGFGDVEIRLKHNLWGNDEGSGHHLALLTSATTSHSLTENTGFFLELVSVVSAESEFDWGAHFTTDLTWAVNPTRQLGGESRAGLADASTDFTLFLGMSTRF